MKAVRKSDREGSVLFEGWALEAIAEADKLQQWNPSHCSLGESASSPIHVPGSCFSRLGHTRDNGDEPPQYELGEVVPRMPLLFR